MKTAIALMIEKVEADTLQNYSYEDVLDLLKDWQSLQNDQIKLAYQAGRINLLHALVGNNKSIRSEDYFTKTYLSNE